jgi:hypothetical protein
VIEGNRALALGKQPVIEDVKHFKKRHIGRDTIDGVQFKSALILWA